MLDFELKKTTEVRKIEGFNLAAKENVVEHGQSSKNKKTKPKSKLGPKWGISKNKFQGKCFNCGKVGHRSWIVDFQGRTTRTMRLMWWITSLKMC